MCAEAADTSRAKRRQQVRCCLERELPSSKFDEETVHYFAQMLDDTGTVSEGALVEMWSPYLISAGACSEDDALMVCRRCVLHLACTDAESQSSLSTELAAWLAMLALSKYHPAALALCEARGIAKICEIWEHWDDFAAELGLKPLEKKRGTKYVAGRAVRRLGTVGPPEDPERYDVLKQIGKGGTSEVYRCARGIHLFAMKTIDLSKLSLEVDYMKQRRRLDREVDILLSLKHKRIVALHDIVEEPGRALHLVMELVEGGDLFSKILSTKTGVFPEELARRVFLQIVEGLSYVHSRGIVHRDLKPDNILVDETASRFGIEVKLTDFGYSKLVDDGYSRADTCGVGTPLYRAPEVLDPGKASQGYDSRADLWSLGIVLYVMLVGSYPFDTDPVAGFDEHAYQLSSAKPSSEREIGTLVKDLVCALLRVEPEDRLSLAACLQHPWITISTGAIGEDVKLCSGTLPKPVEVRIPLVSQLSKKKVAALRAHLATWEKHVCCAATLKNQEIIVLYGAGQRANIECDLQRLQDGLKLHFGDLVCESCVNDHAGVLPVAVGSDQGAT